MTSETSAYSSAGTQWPTRAEEAYHVIRAMVYSGEIASGTLLVEAGLVRQLGMSRTPVRDALRRLETEGLLISVPRGGYAVVELSDGELHDLYLIRAALEGLAAATAAQALTRVDLARLEDLYDEMSSALDEQRVDDLRHLNRRFHQAIALASRNNHLQRMLDDIKGVFERFRTTAIADDDRRAEAHAEHGELISALRERDASLARQLAEQHVHNALEKGTRITSE